ncbi:hypothetical protein BJN45_13015 [Azonexus hydrophilus]|uniref:Diguanylate cyclase n=1 Tax=Azonexus hydrophilus TaxID=418702 RepID=A0A1R1I341_9RHOO|nr:EAL domain-containing protein [Azonexus hydrophilus]OMG53145.1 hypothetical protein BJN45_13015 [Azonexus hydrophilus]
MPTVADLMTLHADSVAPDSTLADAAAMMVDARISSVVVIDDGRITGILTERDMLHAMRQHDDHSRPVRDFMTSPVFTVNHDTEVRAAFRQATRLGIRHLVVTAGDGKLLGIISETDFRRFFGLDFYRQLNTVEGLMDRVFPRLPRTATLDSALAAMETARATSVVVVDGDQACGIVTERDVVRLYLQIDGNPTLGEIMTHPLASVLPETSAAEAAALMLEARIRHLTVVDRNNRLLGLLTEHSLIRPLEMDLLDETVSEQRGLQTRYDEALLIRNAAMAGLLRGERLENLLELIVLSAEHEVPDIKCAIMLAEPAGESLHLAAAPSLPDAACQILQNVPIAEGQGVSGTAAWRRGEAYIEDVFVQPEGENYRDFARLLGGHSGWAEALLGPDKELLGTFAAYMQKPGRLPDSSRETIRQASQLAALLISQQHQSTELQNSRNTFHQLFETVANALFVLDADGHFLDANQAAEQMSGYSRDELRGRTPDDMAVAGMNAPGAVLAAIRAAAGGQAQAIEYWGRNRAGQIVLIRVQMTATCYAGQNAVIASAIDIGANRAEELRLGIERDLANALSTGGGRADLLATMLKLALRFPEFDCGGIYWLTTGGDYELLAHHGLSERFIEQVRHYSADSRQARLIREHKVICSCQHCCSENQECSLLALPHISEEGLRCLLIQPIVVDGQAVACMNLAGRHTDQISAANCLAVQNMARQFALALERQVLEERQRLAASVFANAHEGIMITDVSGRIVEVNPTFSELTGFSRVEAIGQNAGLLNSGHHDSAFYREMWQAIHRDGHWRGEVWNRKKSGEIFVELLTISAVRSPDSKITHFVGIFSDITLLKEHQQRLEHLAHFDALTQLPNRMLLADRLQLAMAHAARTLGLLAVCYLDLDGFKPVNDQFGHAAGDRLLIEVAQRLKSCVRGGDTVARLGGDEFVLLLADLGDIHECDQALNRISASLVRPFAVSGEEVCISASIGVTLYPNDGSDADTLLRHADQAMYVAKQAGRNRHHLFDPENDRRARRRRDEIARIREGLAAEEFVLYYQPKVDMRQGRVVGAEALIRWQHPEQGLLLPQEFLPAIEGSELAIDLGNWVIRTALAQLSAWTAAGIDLALSINIAGEHLQHPGFAEDLGCQLAAWPNVPPDRLELEVLETAAIEDIGRAAQLFEECRRLGVSFALDDFGTGYSSLTYFRRLPAEMLKIDQSFIRDMLDDPEDLAIVEGVIGLTRAFRRKVIAEGVETVEHGLVLLLLGCDLAQGFGIARPMPAAALPEWMAAFRPDELWGAASAFEWSREDLPMLIAEVDHRRWLKTLDACLAGAPDSHPAPELDHRACGFGRWYHGAGARRYGRIQAFAAIDEVHVRLHDVARTMLDLHHAGLADEVAQHVPDLQTASRELSELLQQLQAEILIGAQTSRR